MRAARQESVEAMRPVSIYTAGDRIEAEMLLEALQRNDIQASGRQGVPEGSWMSIRGILFMERRFL